MVRPQHTPDGVRGGSHGHTLWPSRVPIQSPVLPARIMGRLSAALAGAPCCQTFARCNKKEAVGRYAAERKVHHRPRVAAACQARSLNRHCSSCGLSSGQPLVSQLHMDKVASRIAPGQGVFVLKVGLLGALVMFSGGT